VTALYVVLPLALVIGGAAVLAFVWVVHSGQLDDVDTPPRRILFDDEPARPRKGCATPQDVSQGMRGTCAATDTWSGTTRE
jgi:cbb3-type cytochrome oxidase maturation protein